ncbi:MAG: hypothetical protein HQM01_11920 [Magnetococcales bacterium]|nr:hypothetical protein [Magnetococcales bacterium]
MSVEQEAGKAIRTVLAGATAIQVDTAGEIERLLEATLDEIKAGLDGQPGDWPQWYLPQLQQRVRRLLLEYAGQVGEVATFGLKESWETGAQLVDAPLAVTGNVTLAGVAPSLDRRQMEAMQGFLTYKMSSISTKAANGINRELGLVITGLNSPSQAATAIERIVSGGRRRALTVVRTELGRAFSIAAQGRMEQAVGLGLKGLQKQWRRSGKIHSRRSHDLADGQVQPVDRPFMVGGKPIRFPRDPEAPPGETINCGCVSLPFMDDWEMLHPGERPITAAEVARNYPKSQTAGMRAAGVKQWIDATLEGRRKADGEWRTVGTLPMEVVEFLRTQGVEPATMEIAVSDKLLRRPARHLKRTVWMKDLPDQVIARMSEVIDFPKAILWGTHDRSLHYVFELPDGKGLGKWVVRVRTEEKRSRLMRHNYVVSGGTANREALMNRNQFELVSGAL